MMLVMYWMLDENNQPKMVWREENALKITAKQIKQRVFSGENRSRHGKRSTPSGSSALPKVA